VASDIFQIEGKDYLVLIDYYTNFIEVDYLATTSTSQVIAVLKKHFARYGIPKCFISDAGPQYMPIEFQEFAKQWGFFHKTSSPGHHSANGKAEAAVKVIKHMMIKCMRNENDHAQALLELRNTPRQDTNLSPAQMLFGRSVRSCIPSIGHKITDEEKTNGS
jgi:transposase InsO family protein